MRRFPRILSARAQTNLAGGIACCVRCSFFSFSILFLPLSLFPRVYTSGTVTTPSHTRHFNLSLGWFWQILQVLSRSARLPSLASSSPFMFRGLPSERNCSGKRQRNEGVMRTQSGRCSYCFKADRFIYCPNNPVESSWPFASVRGIKLCATDTDAGTPCISFLRYCYHDFMSVVIRQSWRKCMTITTTRKNDTSYFIHTFVYKKMRVRSNWK